MPHRDSYFFKDAKQTPKKSRKQRKDTLHFRVKIFAGLFFAFWIGFVFIESKYGISKQISQHLSTTAAPSSVIQEGDPDADQFSWFLDTAVQTGGIDGTDIESLGSLWEKIIFLERALLHTPSPKIKRFLLEAYQMDHQYLKARKLYYSLSDSERKVLPRDTEFLIFLQSFTQWSASEYQHLKDLFDFVAKEGVLTGEQLNYYQSAFDIAEGNYEKAKTLISSLVDPEFQDYKNSILTAFKQYESLQWVPAYYQNGLLSLQLLNHGFYWLSKKVALPLVSEYPNYILPYQVLANADFALGRTESALSYFQQLLKLDYQQKNNYLYHLWVLSYQLKNYAQAVIFFSQITDSKIALDADRYLVLSYLALNEERKALISWQRLIEYSELKKSDFYTFFQEALRRYYRQGKPSSYLLKEPKLVQAYLSKCQKKLQNADQIVCQYWQIGYNALTNALSKEDLKIIRSRMRSYQYPEFYQLLWMFMMERGHFEQAQEYFLQALNLLSDGQEKSYIKSLILQSTNQNTSS